MTIRDSNSIFESLLGQCITRVSIEPWSVRLLFDDGELHIEGEWILKDAEGAVLDQFLPISKRKNFKLWRILDSRVAGYLFSEGSSVQVLTLDNNLTLDLISNEDGFDDWSLTTSSGKIYQNGNSVITFSDERLGLRGPKTG